jgi:branched-chain amino acid transport system substrate-binding protein
MNRRNSLMILALCSIGAMTSPARAEEPQVVKIGFAAPLTGTVARVGKDQENGVQLALDDANAKHPTVGGKPVRFVLDAQDDQADPRTAIQVAQKLVDNGVVGVIGHYNSGCSIPASAVYNQSNIAMISPASSNPKLTMQGYKNVFRMVGSDAIGGVVAGHFAVEKINAKRIGIIDDRTAFGQGLADSFEKGVQAAGGAVVAREYTNDKAVDFRSILTTLKSNNIDLLFFGGLDEQGAMLLKISGNSGEGTKDLEPGPALDKLSTAIAFGQRYKARFNEDVELFAPFAYDGAQVLISAILSANTLDRAKIAQAVAKTSINGVTGKVSFDERGDLVKPPYTLFRVQKGQWVSDQTIEGSPS